MNINSVFSSYIKADDLQGRRVQVTIGEVRTEEVGKDLKPILYFQGKTKGMVLNRTNANVVSEAYGNETDAWFGRPLILYVAMVDFQGKRVPGLRVEVPRQQQQEFARAAQAPIQQAPVQQAPAAAELDDEVPF